MFVRALAVSFCALAVGCAPTIRDATREATSVAVDEAVDQVTSTDSLRGLAEAVDDPRVAHATQELTDQLTAGLLRRHH